jgi:hypothetical protein
LLRLRDFKMGIRLELGRDKSEQVLIFGIWSYSQSVKQCTHGACVLSNTNGGQNVALVKKMVDRTEGKSKNAHNARCFVRILRTQTSQSQLLS